MRALGVDIEEGAGSRVKFRRDGAVFTLHRPHPGNIMKTYQLELIEEHLKEKGYLT